MSSRWIGFLGSWALLILALALIAIGATRESINIRDTRRLDRVSMIDEMIAGRNGHKADTLRGATSQRAAEVSALQSKVQRVTSETQDVPDTGQTIIVSTAENKLYVRTNGATVFEAVCSTGKGSTLAIDGKTWVFDTPIGKFHVVSKEENPQWVPPDWHYVEQARKNGMRVVHLNAGQSIDADTGGAPRKQEQGFWSSLFGSGGNSGSRRVMRVKGNTVVIDENGSERELPPGQNIIAGDAIVIPPLETKQRHYDKVLGHFRLELGDGYGIHGTDEPDKLGQSVSHGCVRLGDDDIAKLYTMAHVGDDVIIY
jgi:lipoprotein-anchoring transpeptidase ErfK/SrfK